MRSVFRFLIALVAILLMLAVLLSYAGPLLHSLDMLAHFRLYLLWAAGIFGLLAILAGDLWLVWRSLVTALIAAAGLGPVWEKVPAPRAGQQVVVMTANLFQKNPQIEAMLETLRKASPDILVTQETGKSVLTGPDPLTALFPYRLALSTRGQILRTVLWSKFPMRNGRLMLEDSVEPTGALAWVQLANGVEVSVLGLHLAHAYPGNQGRQIAALANIVPSLPEPRIILGDFNAEPWSHAVRRIEQLTATRRIPGHRVTWVGSYPSPLGPLPAPIGHAIDHILVTPGISVASIETVAIPGSDHRAVRAVLSIPDP